MNSTQCKGYSLEPLEIEPHLVAAACQKCKGALLPLLNYRYWLYRDNNISEPVTSPIEVEENDQALICPKCNRLMVKYRISSEHDNRIDLCSSCDEVWLDKGEWELLKKLGIHQQLLAISTENWQREIRQKRQHELQEKRYRQLLGNESFEKASDFKQWFYKHENRDLIRQFLLYE